MSLRDLVTSLVSPFRRRSCPLPPPGAPPRRRWRFRHLVPLVGFVVPTAAIGYGVVIPSSCIAGVNALTIGFATTIAGATVTYVLGVSAALRG